MEDKNQPPASEIDKKTEKIKQQTQEFVDDTQEMAEMGFFESGHRRPLEEAYTDDNTIVFSDLHPETRKSVLGGIGEVLGVDLNDLSKNKVVRKYKEDGVEGAASAMGAEVLVFNTKIEGFELHVMEYKNPEVDTRYDLVMV